MDKAVDRDQKSSFNESEKHSIPAGARLTAEEVMDKGHQKRAVRMPPKPSVHEEKRGMTELVLDENIEFSG